MDRTPEWHAVVRDQRTLRGDGIGAIAALAAPGAAGSWQEPQSAFMQQAAGLNRSMRELHALLVSQFADYIDLGKMVPSKASSMTDAERDALDSEAAALTSSFAQGVEALRILVRQRQAQRQVQKGDDSEEDEADDGGPGAAAADTLTAHYSVCVTFLMERLRSLAAVVETMQAERMRNAREERRGLLETALAAGYAPASDDALPPAAIAAMAAPTPEELAEDALLSTMFPSTYGGGGGKDAAAAEPGELTLGGVGGAAAGEAGGGAGSPALLSGAGGGGAAAGSAGGGGSGGSGGGLGEGQAGADAAGKPGADGGALAATGVGAWRAPPQPGAAPVASAAGSRGGGQSGGAAAAAAAAVERQEAERGGGAGEDYALARENAELLQQFKNELDGARQVEAKMAEISGLMSLFATKVTEQQEEMEAIYDAAMDTHENIKKGSAHLGTAQERSAAARTYYVTFMLVMTAVLLLLHAIAP